MKFSINQAELHNALQKVVSVIPQRSTFIMTQNVLLFTEDNLLKIVGTDLEITLMSWAPASITEEGSVAIPGRLINDIVRELPEGELQFEVDEHNRMRITSEVGRYKITGVNPIEFPQRPELGEDLQQITLENDIFRKLIENSMFACSTDELRAALTGVFFKIGNQRIDAVATDGHRLAKMSYTNSALPEIEVTSIIPLRSLNFVLRNLEGEGSSTIYFGDKHVLFEMADIQIYARLIEESFVDYERVIPKETPFEMLIDSAQFYSSVKRVSLFSNPLTSQVILHLYPDYLELHAEDIDYGGEAQERISCEFNGEDFLIAFNSRYLQDILRHVSTPQLKLRFVRPDYAVLAHPVDLPEGEEQLMLLMPVRLNTDVDDS
ncbi:MAG: DNA polymerase III subunit beta [Calditrichia bacterium]